MRWGALGLLVIASCGVDPVWFQPPPPEDRVLLGDVYDTLPEALERFGPTAALIHADLGGHDRVKNDIFARNISPLVEPLLAVGGLMLASDRMYFEGLAERPLPDGAVPGRCFIYKRVA